MTKKVFILALSFVLVVALVFTGCVPARRPYNNNNITGNRTGYTGTGTDTGAGTNRGYDTGNYTGAGANPGTTGYGTGNETTGYRTGTGTGMGTNAGNTTSDRIATAVRQIQGVQNATAVVTDNTVYVGVTLTGTTGMTGTTGTTGTTGNTANTTDIERRVSQIVKAVETGARTVYVSTDDNFISRLRTVDQGVRGGSPANGFTNDLRNLVRGMAPAR
jgi:YhcN/YlaJ family sporulation lipoprotein